MASLWRKISRLLVVTGILGLGLWLGGVRLYAFQGLSMDPLVRPGDHFVGLIGPWNLRTPQRFDLAIFEVPDTSRWAGQKIPWMKRLVGLPGEHVRISGRELYIDGRRVNAPFLHADSTSAAKTFETTLGEGQYFVLGDNLDHTLEDSRALGPIARARIKGVVALVIHTGTARNQPK